MLISLSCQLLGGIFKISPSWVLSGICKTSLCREDVNWYSLVGTYSPVIPLRKPFNWFPAAPFPWVSKLTECSTIPALKFFFSVFNGITGKKVCILCVYSSFLHYYEIICLFSIFFLILHAAKISSYNYSFVVDFFQISFSQCYWDLKNNTT